MIGRLGALLLAGAWGFVEGHTVPPSWGRFSATAACGAVLLIVVHREERRGDRLARAAIIAGLCAVLAIAIPCFLCRSHAIPGAAHIAAVLLAFAGLRAGADENGGLVLETHAGATAVALTWEMAALPALLRTAFALWAYGGAGRFREIALRAAGWGAFRLLVIAAARGEGLAEPWLREPALILFTMLPLALPAGTRSTASSPCRRMPRPLRLVQRPARLVPAALALGACLGFWWSFHDPGPRAAGRVMIDESHSVWEPTDGPFDGERHGQRTLYNYALWRRWIEAHYPTRVMKTPVAESDLAAADVIVIKTPTRPYDAASIQTLERFVHRGGGLLLIGDHTNLFGMSTVLNPIAAPFGIAFAHDDTFPLDHTRPDIYRPGAWVRHPILRGIASYPFETSCTLAASWRADPVVIGRRLGAESADYGHLNFFGNIRLDPDEPFGLFVQAAVVDHGLGRVAAFSDSTNFSNFSMLWEGRRALTLNLIDWLDRRRGSLARRAIPAIILIAGLGMTLLVTRDVRAATVPARAVALWAALFAFGLAGAAASRAGILLAGEVEPIAPIHTAAFDRSLCRFDPSAVSAVLDQSEPSLEGYDSFFIDTARAGLWPEVVNDIAAAARDAAAIVIINPDRRPSASEEKSLGAFLHRGGKLLVIDSVLNTSSQAAGLLRSLGIEIRTVLPSGSMPSTPVSPRLEVAASPEWSRVSLAAGVTSFTRKVDAGRVVLAIDGAILSDRGYGGVYVNPEAIETERRRAQTALLAMLMAGT